MLLRSKVGGRQIPLEFVVVKVREVFMLEIMVLNLNEPLGPVDPQHLQMKISPRAMIPWSSKFLKLVQDVVTTTSLICTYSMLMAYDWIIMQS
jgi:hypothetical protein